jgi:hypothetical protein
MDLSVLEILTLDALNVLKEKPLLQLLYQAILDTVLVNKLKKQFIVKAFKTSFDFTDSDSKFENLGDSGVIDTIGKAKIKIW